MNFEELGLKVGLEVHQQLATKHKLFCNCTPRLSKDFDVEVVRRLRPTQSELGEIDPAALFEFKKGMYFKYLASEESSCLVELDEEPPHGLNPEAVEIALLIAMCLNSRPVDEIHTMRKLVIDGSNTTGFQRTAIVALGGELRYPGGKVGVQTVCLEEDAARLVEKGEGYRAYALDRLGIPLVEVALEPVTAGPKEVQEIAVSLGRLLRATGRVARGLGTIRQDINVSIRGGGVVEVKGVQRLELISKIIEYEAKRQHGLMKLKELIEERGLERDVVGEPVDLTEIFSKTSCKVLKKAVMGKGRIVGLRLKGFKGLLGYEPYPNVRLGRELAERVRFYGLGGVFHSDELPNYGISEEEVERVREAVKAGESDAFVILAGPAERLEDAVNAVRERIDEAFDGVPSETRAPTPNGETVYSRPRPGPARMYPETDVPPFTVTDELIERLKGMIPEPWEEQVERLMSDYGLGRQLALKLFDSGMIQLFKEIVGRCKVAPTFVASFLTETIRAVERELKEFRQPRDSELMELMELVGKGEISKEGAPEVLKLLMSGEAKGVREAVERLGLRPLGEEELRAIVERVVEENSGLIRERGERAFGPLMGMLMEKLRGRVDGRKVSERLKEAIRSKMARSKA